MPTPLERLETVLTILAIVSAAGFFGWKIIAGWLIVNLEIEIQTQRQRIDPENDWLAINLLLKKGNTDSLWLKDIAVRIYTLEGEQLSKTIRFDEYQSLAITKGKLDWHTPQFERRQYTIAPGEVFRFGRVRECLPANPW